MTESSSLFFFY